MTDFTLGFSIDTSNLKQASADANRAASDIGKLGDAEVKLADSSKKAADGHKAVSDAVKEAEASAKRYIQSLEMEARASKEFERSQAALNKALSDGKVGAQAHAAMMKQLEDAYRSAQREAKNFRESTDGVGSFGSKLQETSGFIRGALGDFSSLRDALAGNGGGLVGGLDAAGGMLSRFGGVLSGTTLAVAGAAAGVVALGAAYYESMKTLGEYQDKMQQLEGRLTNALGSTEAAKNALQSLYESTQKTGLGFENAADAFARIARNNDAIGLTEKQMLQMVDTVQKLGAVSGASGAEIQGAMVQFGQALASGRLQGDELRSIMEQFPALAKAIADNFETADGKIGISTGTLRKMGSEGELTSQKIAEAVLRAMEQTNKEYEKLPETMERANKRLEDSYAKLLSNMGKYFSGSQFVQSVYNFLDTVTNKLNNMFDGALKARDQAKRDAAQRDLQRGYTEETIATKYGVTTMRVPLTPQRRAELQRDAGINGGGAKVDSDEVKKLKASTIGGASIVEENLGDVGTRRKLRGELKTVDDAINANRRLLQIGGTADEMSTWRSNLEDAELAKKNLTEKLNKVGVKKGGAKGGSKGESQLQKLLEDNEAYAEAIAQGGGGGGATIYEQAASMQRTDRRGKHGAGDLQDYLDALTQKAVNAANTQSMALERQTKKQQELAAAVGATGPEMRDLEVKQAAADFRFQHFGTITTPAVEAAMKKYTESLLANKKAIDENAAAHALADAQRKETLAWLMTAAQGDPRQQRRLRFEDQLSEELKNFRGTDQQKADFEKARRGEFSAQEAAIQIGITDAQRKQLKNAEDNLRLATLTTDEYEIQARLLQKSAELEAQGYKKGDAFYNRTMGTEEVNARREQEMNREAQRRRSFVQGWEKASDEIGNLLTNTFDDAYQNGLKSAGGTFLKGMGDIFKQLGNQLVYEIAIRPVVELTKRLLALAAQKIIESIFGSAFGGGTKIGSSGAYAGMKAANGAAFGEGGYRAFSEGGFFTNAIVTSPTLFAFSGGTGLMGEAGPEAIMPLKRGPNGKLGVDATASGGNGTTIVVQDMRSAPTSQPVETKEQKGPDGKRMISILIRDEVRRQIRSGDLDREMSLSYGAVRTLARK